MFNYDFLNLYNGSQSPGTVHAASSALGGYFRRYLLQKAMSVFELKAPDSWSIDYFFYVLYGCGYIAVLDIPGYGVIPQYCTIKGFNLYYQPRSFLIANAAIHHGESIERTIGNGGVLIKLTPDYCGIMDLVGYYADLMAVSAESMGINILNTKLAFVFNGDTQAQIESFKKMFDKINSGQPGVFIDKNLTDAEGNPRWFTFSQNLQQNFVAPEILETMDKIERMFEAEIGIPNTGGTEKKERLIVDEVNMNNVSTYSKAAVWLDNIQRGLEEVRAMFGIDVSCDWRKIEGGVTYGDNSETVGAGTVSVES